MFSADLLKPVSENQDIIFKTFPVGFLQCNCSIIGDPVSKKAIVVDPGGDPELIIQTLAELGLDEVVQIIHTHAHFDHIMAAGHMKKHCGCNIAVHQGDAFLWENLDEQCARYNIPFEPIPPPDRWMEDEEPINIANVSGVAYHTPGHTPGSMSFWFKDFKLLIAGDTLFRGSIGRTDLWGGDFDTIEHSIRHKLYTLDEEAVVITGHGPPTNLGEEMRMNPFVNALNN